MAREFMIYKGLQKPLIYRGFQGKFIAWGVITLVLGLVTGGVVGALVNIIFGAVMMLGVIVGGFFYTSTQQRKGLHNKKNHKGIFSIKCDLKREIQNGKDKEKRI
jgi:hypothetical protein